MAANADPFTALTAKQPLLVELAKFDGFPHSLNLTVAGFVQTKKLILTKKKHEK